MEEQKIELKIINMADIQSQEIEWLWYPFIPYGKLTIIQGDLRRPALLDELEKVERKL